MLAFIIFLAIGIVTGHWVLALVVVVVASYISK